LNFVAVILKVLLVNLLAALNFANVIFNKKRLENKKTLKNVTKINKKTLKKRFFSHLWSRRHIPFFIRSVIYLD